MIGGCDDQSVLLRARRRQGGQDGTDVAVDLHLQVDVGIDQSAPRLLVPDDTAGDVTGDPPVALGDRLGAQIVGEVGRQLDPVVAYVRLAEARVQHDVVRVDEGAHQQPRLRVGCVASDPLGSAVRGTAVDEVPEIGSAVGVGSLPVAKAVLLQTGLPRLPAEVPLAEISATVTRAGQEVSSVGMLSSRGCCQLKLMLSNMPVRAAWRPVRMVARLGVHGKSVHMMVGEAHPVGGQPFPVGKADPGWEPGSFALLVGDHQQDVGTGRDTPANNRLRDSAMVGWVKTVSRTWV